MKFATKAIHVGEEPDVSDGCGDVVFPIHLSTTYARKEIERPTKGHEYSRTDNPTRQALEERLASIEDAKFALAFASGVAAETTLLLSLLKKNDHVIACDDIYPGTKRLFNKVFSNFGVDCTSVDASNLSYVEEAISRKTRMIWLETPSNPLMKLCDIKAIAEIARRKNIFTVVDNTFMSPYFQNPLKLGADIVVHSTTKYLGGHSDVVGGALMLSDEELFGKIKFNQNAVGAIPSPFDCFLVLRGIKTLAVRMERHSLNAQKIAEFLEAHPKVKKVNYPGLSSHIQHELAKRQMSGSGGMLSFEMKGDLNDVKAFLRGVSIFSVAESLGGVESLIEHPSLMTHASVPEKDRRRSGIGDALIRVSVGIEDVEDLISDLAQALKKV